MLFAIVIVGGCGDIIGLGGYTDQNEGGPNQEGGVDGTPIDTGYVDRRVVEACNGMPEDCTDGVDDDCNGQTDCEDVACKSGFTCVPSVPMGWTVVGYGQDQRPPCGTGYGSPTDVEEGVNAALASCGCGCTTTQPNCATGNLTITAGGNGNCNNLTNQMGNAAAGCNGVNSFSTNGDSISVTGPAPSGGSCSPNPAKMIPTVTYQHMGRMCIANGYGAGCMNGNVCIGIPAPLVACISQKGMQACPQGYPAQHLIGTMLADSRDCTACNCKFDSGICGGTATFYTDNGCFMNATNVTVDGQCHGVPNHQYRAFKYAPGTNASCTPSPSNATGGVTFADLTTVCCVN
jgi:hypothetical protein